MRFDVQAFTGLSLAVDPRLLETGQSQGPCSNVRLDNGKLRAWLKPLVVLDNPTTEYVFPGASTYKVIYRWGQGEAQTIDYQHWVGFTKDVDIARGPVSDGTKERTYWTSWTGAGGETESNTFPRYTYSPLVETWKANYLNNNWNYRLGIPPPANGPTGTPGVRPTLDEEEIFDTLDITSIERVSATHAKVNFTTPATRFNSALPAQVAVSGVTPEQYNGTFDVVTWAGDKSSVQYKATDNVAQGVQTKTVPAGSTQVGPAGAYIEFALTDPHTFDTTKTMRVTISGCAFADLNGTFDGTFVAGKLRVVCARQKTVQFQQSEFVTDVVVGKKNGDLRKAVLTFTNAPAFDNAKAVQVKIGGIDAPVFLNGTYTNCTFTSAYVIEVPLNTDWPATMYWNLSTGAQTTNPSDSNVYDIDGVIKYDVTGLATVAIPTTPGSIDGIAQLVITGDTTAGLPASPAPTGATQVTLYGTGTPEDDRLVEDRDYVYTYVSALGEEGPPSPAMAAPIEVVADQPVAVSGFSAPTNVGYGGWNLDRAQTQPGGGKPKIRVYRTAASGTNATFLYVDEFEIPANPSAYSFNDDKSAEELGESLTTNDYTPPPWDLQGFCVMANGICAAFRDNEVWFSAPYLPYAWPAGNAVKTAYKIVAIKPIGSSLVIGTTGTPYVATGIDPEAMTLTKLEVQQACVSKRSMVSMDNGVVYASPDGLVVVDGGGARVVTENLLKRDQWQAYNPSSMLGVRSENRYFAYYVMPNGQRGALVFDFSGTGAAMWTLDALGGAPGVAYDCFAHAAFADLQRDALFYVGDNFKLMKWNAGVGNMTYIWRSKMFEAPAPTNLGCAQVVADNYVANAAGVQVSVQAFESINAAVVGQMAPRMIYSSELFRLPAGFHARYWAFTVTGSLTISSVSLANVAEELARG